MVTKLASSISLALALALAGCNAPVLGPAAPPTSSPAALASPTPTAEATTLGTAGPEAIAILEPAPGSRLVSPLQLTGIADSTFEQVLTVRLISFEGGLLEELAPVMIESEMGTRGPFSADLSFLVDHEQNALIQVLAHSPRDGGVTHMESVGVMLLPDGVAQVKTRDPYPERIIISQPEPGGTVSGGVLHVEGVGIATFEGTLVVQLYDADGALLASQALIVNAPDMGLPGDFALDVSYSVAAEGPGRVVVTDPSPAFDGINHLASVEIRLQP
jgi:hypothetical protein